MRPLSDRYQLTAQEAGDHEEDVNAAVAAGSEGEADVVGNDAEDGDGAEAVDCEAGCSANG